MSGTPAAAAILACILVPGLLLFSFAVLKQGRPQKKHDKKS